MGEKYIILIDDEEDLLNLFGYILDRVGHKAHIFNNGKDAIAEYKKDHSNVDLVITDLSMSEMTGIDVMNAILAINPKEKIIIITGFIKKNVEHLITSKNVSILTKPFKMQELSDMVESMIKCKRDRKELQ